MRHSRSGSSLTATPMISDSSDDEILANVHDNLPSRLDSASRFGSPSISSVQESRPEVDDDSVTCLWDDCGDVFTDLQAFIEHIHNGHIGVNKSNYTCEWATCHRRGLSQTSRFALISHIRSHTGEKPFHHPYLTFCIECDKSFTRSDALAKHMRLRHSIEPPAPGRGGTRKRKRDEVSPVPTNDATFASGSGFGTFKVEQPWSNSEPMDEADLDYENYVRAEASRQRSPVDEEEVHALDVLPPHLKSQYDPSTRRIMGRSPEMTLYILMKAKHKFVLQEQEALLNELALANTELMRVREEKDVMVDRVLHALFGPQAEIVTKPIQKPSTMILDQAATLAYTNGTGVGH
ncbi:hypothetical protein J3R30DRAFT_3698674 [Lentinula aciculospora]|uniref:C2H2-type domain-containing protein n=1 Tax=Lentinula aciculospora TaxID=153920 RepID=A0A9W9DS17_9AGAR|nr:hypothetical protein J3R30DRAFT_3698674 [Lentinula aciculospora]